MDNPPRRPLHPPNNDNNDMVVDLLEDDEEEEGGIDDNNNNVNNNVNNENNQNNPHQHDHHDHHHNEHDNDNNHDVPEDGGVDEDDDEEGEEEEVPEEEEHDAAAAAVAFVPGGAAAAAAVGARGIVIEGGIAGDADAEQLLHASTSRGRSGEDGGGDGDGEADEQRERLASNADITLFLICRDETFDTEYPPNPLPHPVLQPGVTVQIGMEKNTKLQAVFQRYVAVCNREYQKQQQKLQQQQQDRHDSQSHSFLLTVDDLEFVHCQLLQGSDTVEAAALMKHDKISVRKNSAEVRQLAQERERLQRESDREFLQQMRSVVFPEQQHINDNNNINNNIGNDSMNLFACFDTVLHCQGKLPNLVGQEEEDNDNDDDEEEDGDDSDKDDDSSNNAVREFELLMDGDCPSWVMNRSSWKGKGRGGAGNTNKNQQQQHSPPKKKAKLQEKQKKQVQPQKKKHTARSALERDAKNLLYCHAAIVKQRCPWLGLLIHQAKRKSILAGNNNHAVPVEEVNVAMIQEQEETNEDRRVVVPEDEAAAVPRPPARHRRLQDIIHLLDDDDDNNDGNNEEGYRGHNNNKNKVVQDDADDDEEMEDAGVAGAAGVVVVAAANAAQIENDEDPPNNLVRDDVSANYKGMLLVTLDFPVEAVSLLLEYLYTNRVLAFGHDAFVTACKTKPTITTGPVSPFGDSNSISRRRWPNRGNPTVTFAVATATIALAQHASLPRLALMAEVAAAQLVTSRNLVPALTFCQQLKLETGGGNDLPRLRRAAMDLVLRPATHQTHGAHGVWVLTRFRQELIQKRHLLVPTLLTGTMEVLEEVAAAASSNTKGITTGSSHKQQQQAQLLHYDPIEWQTNAFKYFRVIDRLDVLHREEERRKRLLEAGVGQAADNSANNNKKRKLTGSKRKNATVGGSTSNSTKQVTFAASRRGGGGGPQQPRRGY